MESIQNTENTPVENTSIENTPTEAKPMKVGVEPGEVDTLRQEISQTGVADSEADVEQLAEEGPETGDAEKPAFPTSIITSS